MEKKKKKKKKKKEDQDEKTEQTETESEGPNEKDIFEEQIDQLKRQLEYTDAKLKQKREALAKVRSQLEYESDDEQAIVSYLKRVLQFETDRRLEVQEKLETLRDQAELMERRAKGKFATTEQSREAALSQFLQEKLELEGRLFLLEELRLKKNSQMAHLKEVEEALEEKMAALRQKSRDEDMRQVDALLKSREQFLEKCHQVRREWQEAFRLRMPVHAKKQLQENVRLRQMCDKATEKLLQVQEQNRNLKMLQKSLELEEEIQTSAEKDAIKRKALQEKQLKQLLLARQELQFDDGQRIIQRSSENDSGVSKKHSNARIMQQNNRLKEESSSDDAMIQKTVNDEDIGEQSNAMQEIFTPDRKTEIDHRNLKDVNTLQDAVKLNLNTTDKFLVTNNMLKEVSTFQDEIKQKTYTVNHNLEQDNILRKVSELEEVFELETENGEYILKKDDSLLDLFNLECPQKGKIAEVEEILEQINKLEVLTPAQAIFSKNTEVNNQIVTHGNKQQQEYTLEDAVKQRIEAIAMDEAEQCQLLDKCEDVLSILKDQATYKWSLEKELEQNIDNNGTLMSILLRARNILEARCGKLRDDKRGDMDFDLLQQMRFLLDVVADEA